MRWEVNANRSDKIQWFNVSVREKESSNSAEFLNLCELKWFWKGQKTLFLLLQSWTEAKDCEVVDRAVEDALFFFFLSFSGDYPEGYNEQPGEVNCTNTMPSTGCDN